MLPGELRRAIDEALEIVERHPDHEYGPQNRKKLMAVFKTLGTPLADRARRRLSIVTVRHVLPLHSGPHMPQSHRRLLQAHSGRMTPEERHTINERKRRDPRFEEPQQALALAERVMRGEVDAADALQIASDVHLRLGKYRPVASIFVQEAANNALCEVAEVNFLWRFDALAFISPETDIHWAAAGLADTAALAAAAWSCEVDPSNANSDWADAWSSWDETFDPGRLHEFWRWWLLEGVPQAWVIEEEAAKSLTDSQGG